MHEAFELSECFARTLRRCDQADLSVDGLILKCPAVALISPRLIVMVNRHANALAILDRGFGRCIDRMRMKMIDLQKKIANKKNRNRVVSILRDLLVPYFYQSTFAD